MFLVNVLSYLDRQVLSIVQESMKEDFGWTDADLGWLQLAFGVSLALCAVPIGRLADRISRKNVLMGCLTLWSAATVFAGLATNFVQMTLARIGVGIGEAGVTPTAYAMVSDKFPPRRRATALAVCGIGVPIGVALSLILGGMISETLGWRWAFILFGAPGFLVAIIMALFMTAPRKGEADGIKSALISSLAETVRRLFSAPAFTFVLFGAAFMSIAAAGILNWMPSYLQRKFDLGEGEVGIAIGLIIVATAVTATLSAAYLGDRLSEKDTRWYAWIVVISQLLSLPLILISLFSDNYIMALVFFAGSAFFSNSMLAISNALIQNTSPVHMRSTASALKSMALTFLGFGAGSFLIGQMSEHVFNTGNDATDLMWALAVGSSFHVFAALSFWMSGYYLRTDIDRAATDSGLT